MGLKTEMILIVNTYDCGAGVFIQRHFARIIKVRSSICKLRSFFFFFLASGNIYLHGFQAQCNTVLIFRKKSPLKASIGKSDQGLHCLPFHKYQVGPLLY